MKLIVGLGNPDQEYDGTRHNVGFRIVDNYLGAVNWQNKMQALFYKTTINNEIVYFVKPLTYMNLSGDAVAAYVNYFKINLDDILIIQDDLDEALGTFKLKKKSSSGGHNGIKSIIQRLGTDDFARLKVGIGNNQTGDTIDFVLGKFSAQEAEILAKLQPTFNDIITSFIEKGIAKTMNVYNTK